ncbi:DUF6587 family protein [Uliginosibacterium aquaticum]|uniref:Uncharacterized protein n=1 Tax=Uliginosibacterium aquaticum TaxID=2731212 RepID=A0ABX2II18_9RHOO|nr:DUF6587 family protein [Uliginosibacterium aquaticum]NSL53730.1 hypothetical protein [Uliginosibacterium aquaticum]
MSYASLEPVILALVLVFSLWLALRKAAPKLSLLIGAATRKAGLPEAVASRLFGSPAACNSGCGSCGGCEKPAESTPVNFHPRS